MRTRAGIARTAALVLVLLAGCAFPVRDQADLAVEGLSAQLVDVQPITAADVSMPYPPVDRPERPVVEKGRILRLRVPPDLPGANAPPIEIPSPTSPDYQAKKREAFRRLYPALPVIGPDPRPVPGPHGRALTLAQLQHLALTNSPLIRQAAADVEANRGALIKARAYPNPTFGYEADTIGTGILDPRGGGGYQGAFIDQVIKTGGKLKLAEAAARMDLYNSQLALRRAQTDLMAQVRGGYFAVLVAQENIRVNRALVKFTDEIFRVQVELVKATQAGPYEPMQLRVLAYQARGNLLQARNRYVSAWKQLAANIGLPGIPPTQLAGRVDMAIPVIDARKALAKILSTHTDVGTAEYGILRARYNLRQAQVTPIPDVEVRVMVQKDFTTAPFLTTPSLQVSAPIPIWDQNRGGIIQAQGQLLRAVEESHRVRDDLTQRFADAYERYDNNRRLLEYYQRHILPDQVRVYKGVWDRHNVTTGEVSFGDVVTAQQTLAAAITTYVSTLGLQWQAVVDLASLLQTNDLFHADGAIVGVEHPTPVPDVGALPPLPCCHPSSPAHDPHLRASDPDWPAAMPEPRPATPARPADQALPMPRRLPPVQ